MMRRWRFSPVLTDDGIMFVTATFDGSRLSLSGVVGPYSSGNCRGGAGQCVDELDGGAPIDGWTRETVDALAEIWRRWHLNDMRAGCVHQRAADWHASNDPVADRVGQPCDVCGYHFGSAWLSEDVPLYVFVALDALPSSERDHPWGWMS